MENIKIGKSIDRSYYLTNSELFARIREIMGLMPNFAVGETKKVEYTDTFYETSDYFLKQLGAFVRIRKTAEKQTLSIVCNNLGVSREFEMEMAYNSKLTDKDEYILFLEDKIQDIYTHKIDVDVIRVLHHLKPFLIMTTNRTIYEILTSTDFKAEVDFDKTYIETKRNKDMINVVKFKNKCFISQKNEETFNRFVKEFEKRLIMIPMNEKKLDAGLRVVNREW